MAFVPERYEFIHAIRVGSSGAITCATVVDYEIHEFPDHVIIIDKISKRATQVERTNLNYTLGKWIEPVTEFKKKNNLKAVNETKS